MILVFALLGASFIGVVYASTYSLTRTKVNVGTVTNNVCAPITDLTTTHHEFMNCGTLGGTSWTVRVVDGDTQTASLAITIVAGSEVRQKFYPIDTNIAVLSTGATASGTALLREYTLSGTTLTNTRTFNAPCTLGAHSVFNQAGTSVWFACTDGTIREVGLTTFTQLNSYTGLTTGTPTCTTPRGAGMFSATVGLAICDTSNAILFHLSGASIVKDDSISLSNNYSTGGQGSSWFYNNGYVYFLQNDGASPEAINITITGTPNIVSTSPIAIPISADNAFGIAGGNYFLISSADADLIYVLDGNQAPPNNFVTSFSIGGDTWGANSRIGTSDFDRFVLSKGDNGNSTIYYFTLTNFLVNGGSPSSGGATGPVGIDCTDPNFSYRLMCQSGNGNGALVGASQLLNQSSTNIICQIGLLPGTITNNTCTLDNPDIKTNGVGYILFLVAMAIFVGIMWVASRGQLMALPTFIWFVGIVGIAGLFTVIQWLDPTILILTVVAVVAFAVAKVKGFLGGQQLFAGEQT